MHKVYLDESTEILKNYLENNHFKSWTEPRGKHINGLNSIEIYLTSDCSLACAYCYLYRHEDKLYPKEIRLDHDKILKNIRMIFEWLVENKYTPGIEFFSGSALESGLGLKMMDLIYTFFKDVDVSLRPDYVMVPTNYMFILDDDLTNQVEDYIEKIEELEIELHLSASIDGKHMEVNRPFRAKKVISPDVFRPDVDNRDDEFYDKVFQFNKKHNYGFHPMVYSKNIEKWKENFLWFQDMFTKHGFHFSSVYLLEVRNMEWSQKQLDDYVDFIEFLLDWTWNKVDRDPSAFIRFIMNAKGYNILTNSLFRTSRGTTCGLQNTLYVRAGDLKIVPCHRTSYDGYNFGNFITDGDKIVGMEAENVEMAIAISTFHASTQPHCERCLLKETCMKGCMGAQLEYTGDLFTPIPTVCELIHRKTYAILNKFKEYGVYNEIMASSSSDIQNNFNLFMKSINSNRP